MIYSIIDLITDGFKWLFADKKERAFMSIPYNCQCCELLGICRDEDNNWKCRNGCIIINQQKSTAYFDKKDYSEEKNRFAVTAQKDTIMNISENTPYVYTKPLN